MKPTVLPLLPLLVLDRQCLLVRDVKLWLLAAGTILLSMLHPSVPPEGGDKDALAYLVLILWRGWIPGLILSKIGYALAAMAAVVIFPPVFLLSFLAPRSDAVREERWKALKVGILAILVIAQAGFWKDHVFPGVILTGVHGGKNPVWFYVSMTVFIAWAYLVLRRNATGENRWLAGYLILSVAGFIAGTLFPAARFIMPVLPALVILFLLDLGNCRVPGTVRALYLAALAGNLWLGLSLVYYDTLFARFCRDAARLGAREAAALRLPLMTTGAWSQRYYVELAGGTALGSARDPVSKGCVMIDPERTDHRILPAGLRARITKVTTWNCPAPRLWPLLLPVRTVPVPRTGATFHGGYAWFPYAFSRAPVERINLLVIAPQDLSRSRPKHATARTPSVNDNDRRSR
jgi:hypothetical protein